MEIFSRARINHDLFYGHAILACSITILELLAVFESQVNTAVGIPVINVFPHLQVEKDIK